MALLLQPRCAGTHVLARPQSAAEQAQKRYDPGASNSEIKVGHIVPYSGPLSAYGAIGKAIDAYIRKVNEEGGINGRKLNFISLDDGYSPPRTVEQARRLVEQDQVLLIFQTLGTPGNSAIHKYMNQRKVPQIFVATGATRWSDPKNFPWTMGWQPNYQSEARIYAQAIRKAAEIGWKPTHDLNSVSNAAGSVMVPAGAESGIGIISAFYIKDPTDTQWHDTAEYKDWLAFMRRFHPQGDLKDNFNVYSYTVAPSLVEVLRKCGDNLTRENVMRQVASLDLTLPMLLPGVNIKTGPDDFYPIEREQLARWDGKTWVLFGKVLGRSPGARRYAPATEGIPAEPEGCFRRRG